MNISTIFNNIYYFITDKSIIITIIIIITTILINTYDIINNSAIDSIHPRPRSGRTGNIANHYILTMIDIYFI